MILQSTHAFTYALQVENKNQHWIYVCSHSLHLTPHHLPFFQNYFTFPSSSSISLKSIFYGAILFREKLDFGQFNPLLLMGGDFNDDDDGRGNGKYKNVHKNFSLSFLCWLSHCTLILFVCVSLNWRNWKHFFFVCDIECDLTSAQEHNKFSSRMCSQKQSRFCWMKMSSWFSKPDKPIPKCNFCAKFIFFSLAVEYCGH